MHGVAHRGLDIYRGLYYRRHSERHSYAQRYVRLALRSSVVLTHMPVYAISMLLTYVPPSLSCQPIAYNDGIASIIAQCTAGTQVLDCRIYPAPTQSSWIMFPSRERCIRKTIPNVPCRAVDEGRPWCSRHQRVRQQKYP